MCGLQGELIGDFYSIAIIAIGMNCIICGLHIGNRICIDQTLAQGYSRVAGKGTFGITRDYSQIILFVGTGCREQQRQHRQGYAL